MNFSPLHYYVHNKLNMRNTSRRITWTILSMSLLTVMAGAAIAPALDIIRAHFADQDPLLLVALYLPNEHLGSSNKRGVAFQPRQLLKFHPSVIGMFLLMMVFFIFPTNFAITAHERTNLSAEMITVIMVGFDVVAFFVGLLFSNVMRWFRRGVKYFASLFFLAAYAFFALGHSVPMLLIGCALGGIANGVGVPYLNTIASIKGGKNSATTVMPLLSAALYLGQFVSPIIVTPLSHSLFGTDATGCYKIGMIICLIFLWQTWSTRHFQSLPPEEK